MLYNASPEAHFWDKVIIIDGACWKWRGERHAHGYSVIRLRGNRKINWLAHRLSWQIHNGPIPEGLCICHKCDNPECTNPEHLFLGTQLDNIKDCTLKKRVVGNCHAPKGE